MAAPDKSPWTSDQQITLRLLGQLVSTAFQSTLEARINIAAMQELLKQRHILTDEEWTKAVEAAEQRWRTDLAIEAFGDRDLDAMLARLNRLIGGEEGG